MRKIKLLLSTMFLLTSLNTYSQLLNPGFESETGTTISDWTDNGSGTENVGTLNARTGTNALSYTTSSSTNQDMRSISTLLVANNDYVHIIGWAVGNDANAQASIGTVMGSYNQSSNISTIGTTLTRLTFSGRNIQGSAQSAIVKLNSRSVSGSVTLYWDDIVIYSAVSSSVDLVDPNFTSIVTSSSNANGTSITLNWTQGTDASSGIRGAIILRADGLSQTPPELNDQGKYSTSGGSDGPNTIGSWTVVGNLNQDVVNTFTDNSASPNTDYSYAVYMRDGAFNYSAASTSNITSLPVELSSFSAFTQGNAINLKWQTKTETNNYGFEVERSQTSEVKGETWQKIGFVNGSGNSNSPKDYNFTDRNATSGKFFYRLKQIDTDGKYEFSKEVEVDLGLPKNYTLGQNYPNPFNPTTKINYTLPVESDVQLLIFTVDGELVKSIVNARQSAGVYTINFDASELASGTYIYKLLANDYIHIKKMLLIK